MNEMFYIYVKADTVSFIKEFTDFRKAVEYLSRYEEMDSEADVTFLIPWDQTGD